MDKNVENKPKTGTREESKGDGEDTETENLQEDGRASTKSSEDTEEDEDDSLHSVSSVKEIKRTTEVVTLEEGTHTTATETEYSESVTKIDKHLNYEQIIEELATPAPSTSKVVENVREYVKQIESLLEDTESALPRCNTTTPQPCAAQIIEPVKEVLTLETIKVASELSFTSKQSDESASQLSEVEHIAHDEVERIVAENEGASTMCAKERSDFQQVERENQEIAERFKQIMEMFDNFTKNLESLEMPAIKPTEELNERVALPLRRRLSFKGTHSADMSAPAVASAGATASASVYNEFYLQVHGESKTDANLAANRATTATQNLAIKSYNAPSSCYSYTQKAEAALDPMYRDIATTVSGLELHSDLPTPRTAKYRQYPHDVHNLSTIGCQTTDDWYILQASSSVSTSFSNLQTAAKEYSQTDDDSVGNILIIDSIADATTSSGAGAVSTSFTDTTETSNITVVKPCTKIHGTTDQSGALVKIREPPTIIDITQDDTSPTRVTTVVADAPCERTYHTINIESNSSPSSSEMRRPPLCSRLWNVITDFCAAVCLCLQVNKDCLFCLGFFIAFVVSASFLTAFFYRTLSINPQLLQAQATSSYIAHHVNTL